MSESGSSDEPACCFVIAPIGASGSEIRKRSDQVLDYIIRPVVSEYGYRALRADEIAAPGLITSQVIEQVMEAPLVVADLTTHNPNVFYELALRHALRKPVIQLSEVGETLPFDVGGLRTIFLDHHDMGSVEACKEELRKQVEGLQSGRYEIDSPISIAVDLQGLRQSGNPIEMSAAEVLNGLADLRRMVVVLLERDAQTRAMEQRWLDYVAKRTLNESHIGRTLKEVTAMQRATAPERSEHEFLEELRKALLDDDEEPSSGER